MLRSAWRGVVACGVVLAFATVAQAQAPQANENAQGKVKKRANQVPETGDNDSGEAAAADSTFDKATDIAVTTRSNGTLVAVLDASFMEAETVALRPDGTLEFSHFTGLDRAIRAVIQETFATGKSAPRRVKPLITVLEEKE